MKVHENRRGGSEAGAELPDLTRSGCPATHHISLAQTFSPQQYVHDWAIRPGDVVYGRVLNFLDERDDRLPFLIVVESVTSHHPFIPPYSGERTSAPR